MLYVEDQNKSSDRRVEREPVSHPLNVLNVAKFAISCFQNRSTLA